MIKMTLYPPIIDNTVGAFELIADKNTKLAKMPIRFYYQEENVQTSKYVFVKIEYDGAAVLNTESGIWCAAVQQIFEPVSIMKINANQQYYSCTLYSNLFQTGALGINKGYSVKIATVFVPITEQGKSLFELIEVEGVQKIKIYTDDADEDGTIYSLGEFFTASETHEFYSEWSDTVVKYAIPPVQFSLYGNLTKEEMQPGADIQSNPLAENDIFPYP
jgi:hypothetical protein